MERAPLRQTDITIAGIRSPLIEGGKASAEEAVVFVHGNPGSSRDWEELAAQVSPFARAVALDMPAEATRSSSLALPERLDTQTRKDESEVCQDATCG
jgi:pimeloyl-ACP methyl ester carboxylesterase